MNAGTSFITNLSPYFVRVSFTLWHSSYAMGEAAAKTLHAKTAVVAYSDYPPGKDSLDAFKYAFEHNGGKVLDAIPAGGPTAVPDFTPFFQRAKDEHPDVLFVFVPAGDFAVAVVKTYTALGMKDAGIKLIGPGDIVQDNKLQGMGDAAIGLITMHHYNADLDNPENKRFVAAWKQAYGPDSTPDFTSVGAYDGLAAIVHAVQATKGKMDDGDAAVKSLLGWKFDSPRGPIMIDPETRDIVMNEYLDEVVKGADGKLHEKVLEHPQREGRVQGAGYRPLRAEVSEDYQPGALSPTEPANKIRPRSTKRRSRARESKWPQRSCWFPIRNLRSITTMASKF
jgi:branched-chain amino acid transport system substrate-binding protein